MQLMTEGCRSMSDPDLTTCDDKERSSISSGEIDINDSSNTLGVLIGNVKQRGTVGSADGQRIRVRYSDNSLERSEVSKMIENLKKVSAIHMGENGTTQEQNSGNSKWKIGKKSKVGKPKEVQKGKKVSKTHSSEDILEQTGNNNVTSGGTKEGDNIQRSSSDSPQDTHSPVPKKKNTTGIFKKKKKTSNVVPLHHTPSPQDDAFVKEGSTPPPSDNQVSPILPPEEGLAMTAVQKHVVSVPISAVNHHAPPSKRDTDVHFNLETLVLPVNRNWIKCGYLWLRMKLPNGRYAWTHIVSVH